MVNPGCGSPKSLRDHKGYQLAKISILENLFWLKLVYWLKEENNLRKKTIYFSANYTIKEKRL